MKTRLDCIPCFLRQALDTARLAGASFEKQKRIVFEVAEHLGYVSLRASPPEIAQEIYTIVNTRTGRKDPYRKIKEQSTALALRVYPLLQRNIASCENRLSRAVELAVAGNIIDYGVRNSLDISGELKKILKTKGSLFGGSKSELLHYRAFQSKARESRNILYLADNAGETVFDRLLIEELKRLDPGKEIIYAVRESPIINDALAEDAYSAGIQNVATVISSGSNAPGTILSACTEEFRKLFADADMVISKGQGNFETLSEEKKPIFFLLKAKCAVVAGHIGCNVGDVLLLSSESLTKRKGRIQ